MDESLLLLAPIWRRYMGVLKITRMICLLLLSLIALVGSVGSESYNFLLFYFWNLGLRIVLE
jgi:hypothetical protein